MWRKGDPLALLVGMQIDTATMEKTMEIPLKTRNKTTVWPSNPSQKEKNKYCVLTHIYGIYKESNDEHICRAAMETQTETRLMDKGSRGVEGEGETNGEGSTEAYTLTYVKQVANGNLLYDSGNSNWGSAVTQRGEMGREMGRLKSEGTYVHLWLINVDV